VRGFAGLDGNPGAPGPAGMLGPNGFVGPQGAEGFTGKLCKWLFLIPKMFQIYLLGAINELRIRIN
jgi:hypothetical protein